MAKTELNKKIDTFFNAYSNKQITPDIVKRELPYQETNEYGNILHALVNYKYPEKAVLKTMKIVFDLGVNPNYQGERTGMTFIHLALYGYTDNETDCSYSENFILSLIELAKQYGFNTSIRDHDNETIVMAAMASEIYTGHIYTIAHTLNPDYKFNQEDIDTFNLYLKEAEKTSKEWHSRLLLEKWRILEEETKKKIETFADEIKILDYAILKEKAQTLGKEKKEIGELLGDVSESQNYEKFDILLNKIEQVISSAIEEIRKNPRRALIKELRDILGFLEFAQYDEKLDTINQNYEEFLNEIMRKAEGIESLNEGILMHRELEENEDFQEIENVVNQKINELKAKITFLNALREKRNKMLKLMNSILPMEIEKEEINDEDATIYEINEMGESIEQQMQQMKEKYMEKLKEYFLPLFPLIQEEIITPEEIIEILTQKKYKKGRKYNGKA